MGDIASLQSARYGPPAMTAAKTVLAYPGALWERAADHGWSTELLARARTYSERAGSTAVVIVQHGRVVAAWGEPEHKSPIASVRKSLLSALYGLAVEEGTIRLDATLGALGIDDKQALSADEKQATIADLLTTRSGVYHPVDSQPVDLAGPLPARGSHPHGTHFYYNNWDFNVLGTIYQQQTGDDIYDAFRRRIAEPIGLQDFFVSDGVWGTGEMSDHRNYTFTMSARDLARFGLLYLRRGAWQGRQVVPAQWVDDSTRTHAVVRSQTFAGRGYGYMWWTGFGSDFAPTVALPRGTYHALGLGSQYLVVVPAHDIVIVHTVDMARDTWPEISNEQIGRLLWLILSAAGVKDLGPDTSATARTTILAGGALRSALSGTTLRFADEAVDGPYRLRLDADGRALLHKGPERRLAKSGKWWIEGESLCRGWEKSLPRYDSFPVGIDGDTVSLYQNHDTMYLQAVIERE